jgi:hypothetical protein
LNRTQALRLAITALEFKRARYRMDANLAEKYGADYPAAINAQKMVDQINQAIAILQKEIEAHTHYQRQVIQ